MFVIRQAKSDDVGTLLKLARMVYFINLPPDEKIIASKVRHSAQCFKRAAQREAGEENSEQGGNSGSASGRDQSDLFMFAMEEVESGGVVGTSQILARVGGPGNPNYAMKLSPKEFRSKSLGFGTTHLVAKLHKDESAPTEIGGLILQPSFRGHKQRPGRLLSFARFHFIGLNRELFADQILAEMMAPVSSDGDNLFWDHIGRKFIPVKYAEADRFCQHNRKFIEELLPQDELYLSLLPLEVLNTVGQVGKDTIPARRMLEKLGFAYRNFIDPFDGGPHLHAATDSIALIRGTHTAGLGENIAPEKATHTGIVSVLENDGRFAAVEAPFAYDGQKKIRVTAEAGEALGAKRGARVGVTPIERLAAAPRVAKKLTAKPSTKKVRV